MARIAVVSAETTLSVAENFARGVDLVNLSADRFSSEVAAPDVDTLSRWIEDGAGDMVPLWLAPIITRSFQNASRRMGHFEVKGERFDVRGWYHNWHVRQASSIRVPGRILVDRQRFLQHEVGKLDVGNN